jgi:Icc-related predicted phosphoesterase
VARLVAVGDLHGVTDDLFRLLDAESDADGLLCVGDWGDPGQIPAATWDTLLARVPVLTVFGNHDDLPFLASLRNRDGSLVLLGQGERRVLAGLAVAAVSGIWAKSHRLPHYVTDEDVAGWAAALAAGPPVDILLTHGCPMGVADRTSSGRPGGQRCFLDLLKAVRPAVHLCGHLHVAQHRDLSEPPCRVLNTGALPDGHYVLLTGEAVHLTAEPRRLE